MAVDLSVGNGNNWLMEDDINLFDSLAGLLDDDIGQDMNDGNDVISDLESCAQSSKSVVVKSERGGKSAPKKRKFNPDSEVIAAATDETLKQLDLDPNSKEGKLKRRQIRNRLSAQFHRDRKNAHMNTLEQQLANKDLEIASLKEQITALLRENEYLRKLNPGFMGANRQRTHAASLSSYPGSVNHTDSEDSSLPYLLNARSTVHTGVGSSGASSVTVSPMDSPQHNPLEGLLPSIPPTNLPLPISISRAPPAHAPSAPLVSPGGAPARAGLAGAGTGMLHVPSGLARPLSIITMVCMVSIMLLSGTQGPTMGGVTLPHSPYQLQQAALRDAYVRLLSGLKPATDLTVGREMLALMHTEAGVHHVETRQTMPAVEEIAPASAHGRRLSAEEDSGDENSETSLDQRTAKRQRGEDGAVSTSASTEGATSRSRANSLFDEALMTPEEEAAATRAISTLNLESIAPAHLLQQQQHQATAPAHRHLRRSPVEVNSVVQPRRNSSRQVIYSSGVVSRGLVEDTVAYHAPAHHRADRVYAGENTTEEGVESGTYPTRRGMYGSAQDYQWPASQAFDYAVQSYSKVVMTEGQALLDPSLALHKNPFAWTRAMFQHDGNGYTEDGEERGLGKDARERVRRAAQREPTIVERGEEDTEGMDVASPEDTVTSTALMPVVRALPPAAVAADAATSNAVVPVVKGELPNLPALLHHSAYHAEYNSEGPSEHNVLNKLLGESNFMTLKLPASSIRVGKSWGDSKMGTVESIMEVFNITAPAADAAGEQATFRVPTSADASVEINCIILGAKLVLSEQTSA